MAPSERAEREGALRVDPQGLGSKHNAKIRHNEYELRRSGRQAVRKYKIRAGSDRQLGQGIRGEMRGCMAATKRCRYERQCKVTGPDIGWRAGAPVRRDSR